MPLRFDRSSLAKAQKLPGGELLVEGYLGRTGVQEYLQPDGSVIREYRPPEEVFSSESLASWKLVPFTDDHPPKPLDAESTQQYQVGTVGENVRRDGQKVAAPIRVNVAKVVRKIDDGKVELSGGYTCDVDETPGICPEGKPYDRVQRQIRGNHVALVDVGRAGHEVRIRTDAAQAVYTKENAMDFEKLYREAQTQIVQLTSERDQHKARADRAEGERDTERRRADAAEKARTDAASGVGTLVDARVELQAQAAPILGKDFKFKGVTDVEIKRAVVKRFDGVDVSKDATADYVEGAYASVMRRAGSSPQMREATEAETRVDTSERTAPRVDGDELYAEDKAREAWMERSRNAWKSDTGADVRPKA